MSLLVNSKLIRYHMHNKRKFLLGPKWKLEAFMWIIQHERDGRVSCYYFTPNLWLLETSNSYFMWAKCQDALFWQLVLAIMPLYLSDDCWNIDSSYLMSLRYPLQWQVWVSNETLQLSEVSFWWMCLFCNPIPLFSPYGTLTL